MKTQIDIDWRKISEKDINESNIFISYLSLKMARKIEKFLATKKISSSDIQICMYAKNPKYSKNLKPGKSIKSKFNPC
jgi:hypothetical protein